MGTLTNIRWWVKDRLTRGTWLYKAASRIYTGSAKILSRKTRKPAREITDNSIFTEEEELPMCSLFPKEALEIVLNDYAPQTLLDIGSGTGVSLRWFHKKGIDVQGVEGSALAISKSAIPEKILQHDLHQKLDLGKKYDAVWCFEVAEHIHPDYADTLVESIAAHSDQLFVSAAPPGQGGCGHLNEQPPEYWIEKFRARGFQHDPEASKKFHALQEPLCKNMLVFKKHPR